MREMFVNALVMTGFTFFCVVGSVAAHRGPNAALKGLDPVALISGKEIKGRPDTWSDFGRFHYIFASTKDKKTFDSNPLQYSIQHDGRCAHTFWMAGNPDMFVVYERKIYLAGTTSCLAEVKKDPASHVKAMEAHKKVAIMLFPEVQIIDYTGPYEVFGQAGYEVYTVAARPDPIIASGFMTVVPTYTFDNCPEPDILVLPGGNVDEQIARSDPQIQFVLKKASTAQFTMSVCNGAFWLANAGLLDGKDGTTFYGLLDTLKKYFPRINVVYDKRFVDNGKIMCTAGLSSGIDGALHMVEKVDGHAAAKAVAFGMEYNWQPDSGYARGAFADKYLRRTLRFGSGLPSDAEIKVLDVMGDRNYWSKTWSIKGSTLSQMLLMENIVKQLSANWTKTGEIGSEKTTWKFSGEDGKPWTAEASVQHDAANQGQFIVCVRMDGPPPLLG